MSTKLLKTISARKFENLVYDIVVALGLRNALWRSPGRDSGRDIEGDYYVVDISESYIKQKWYIECKKYASSVGWPVVREKLCYAEANSADCLLVVTTSTISPQCLDQIEKWNSSHSRPQIRHWSGHELNTILLRFPLLQIKYGLRTLIPNSYAHAFLPLSQIVLKYIYSANSAVEFEQSPNGYLEVAAALSDMISNKLEQFKDNNEFAITSFRNDQDSFEWLSIHGTIGRLFDRFVLRALIIVFQQISAGNKVQLSVKSFNELTLQTDALHFKPTFSQQDDLHNIASWDNLELSFKDNIMKITRRTK